MHTKKIFDTRLIQCGAPCYKLLPKSYWSTIPIYSIYDILTYIWAIFGVNVATYSSTMVRIWVPDRLSRSRSDTRVWQGRRHGKCDQVEWFCCNKTQIASENFSDTLRTWTLEHGPVEIVENIPFMALWFSSSQTVNVDQRVTQVGTKQLGDEFLLLVYAGIRLKKLAG